MTTCRQLSSSSVDFEFPMSSYQTISIWQQKQPFQQVIEVCGDRVPMDERRQPKQALPGHATIDKSARCRLPQPNGAHDESAVI
jgi:hypothetical protein